MVVNHLVKDEAITDGFAHRLLVWKRSGGSLNKTLRVGANDPRGYRQSFHYIIRNPFSLNEDRLQTDAGACTTTKAEGANAHSETPIYLLKIEIMTYV